MPSYTTDTIRNVALVGHQGLAVEQGSPDQLFTAAAAVTAAAWVLSWVPRASRPSL